MPFHRIHLAGTELEALRRFDDTAAPFATAEALQALGAPSTVQAVASNTDYGTGGLSVPDAARVRAYVRAVWERRANSRNRGGGR